MKLQKHRTYGFTLNVCFKAIGKPSDKICFELDKQGLAKMGYCIFEGENYIRLVFVNPDITEYFYGTGWSLLIFGRSMNTPRLHRANSCIRTCNE